MKKIKNTTLFFCCGLLMVSCSSDNGGVDESKKGNFSYTVTGAASKTVSGDNARFGSTGSFDQTFISLVVDSDELDIRVVLDPISPGTYEVNPIVVKDGGGQIINIPVEAEDSWVDLGIGSTLAGDRRSFSTSSANGGSVTITNVDADMIVGTFNVSMMELLGGADVFNNPKVTVQGNFTATKN